MKTKAIIMAVLFAGAVFAGSALAGPQGTVDGSAGYGMRIGSSQIQPCAAQDSLMERDVQADAYFGQTERGFSSPDTRRNAIAAELDYQRSLDGP